MKESKVDIHIDSLKQLDQYHVFKIIDDLEILSRYNLADENLLEEVKRIIEEKV